MSTLPVGFARVLDAAGLPQPTGSVVTYTEALAAVGLDDADRVYWAGRATLVHRPEDIATYDRVWRAYWLDRPGDEVPGPPPTTVALAYDDPAAAVTEDGSGPPGETRAVRYSAAEVLGHRDLATLTEEEWREASRLIARLRVTTDHRPGRRRRRARAQRGTLDLPASLRRSLRTDGELVRPVRRPPVAVPRRLVLLADVSGSMEAYSRALLRFAQAAVAARSARRAEVFALGTRLTRLTRELDGPDPDLALRRATAAVMDWSGGTRLGAALADFNDRWGTRGVARGAIVVILSDGWDRGEPEVLAEQMARLARVARRIVWVNPLKASPGYQPLARGMAAALPYVDRFVEGHSLDALSALAELVGEST